MEILNKNQELAIKTIEGPVLIIAGPGTGKTFTLVERVVYMVGDLGIDPSSILISTFTNKAANELLDRLSLKFKKLNISKDVNEMLLGNFHSICRRLLDDYIDYLDIKKGFRIIDDVEKRYLIYRNLNLFQKIPGYYDIIKNNDVKNIDNITKLVFEEGILDRKSEDKRFQTIFDITSLYEKMIVRMNVLDFSSQLYFAYKLLEEEVKVREDIKSRIKYIMIDEYQDTNKIQEKIIKLLLNDEENICVVGDDDQGLYRFRGATVKNILNFGDGFNNNIKRINLDINYRSKSDIIEFYSKFIDQLSNLDDIDNYRYRKSLKAFDEDKSKSVYKVISRDEESYRQSIVQSILKLKEKGTIQDYNQVSILVSSVNDPRITKLSTALKRAGIGVYTPKTTNLISLDETQNLIGAFYAIFKDYIDKNKMIFSVDTSQFLGECYTKFFKSMSKSSETEDFVKSMSKYLNEKKFRLTLLDIVYRLFRYEPFSKFLGDKNSDKEKKNISRFIELLNGFSFTESIYYINESNIRTFSSLFFGAFVGYIREEKVSEFEEDTKIPDKNQVSLLTIHASKGMEYPVVFTASLWDKYFNRYSNVMTRLLDDFLAYYGKKVFEPFEYIEKMDFYRKYYTAFSRAENLLILAGISSNELKLIGTEFTGLIDGLQDFGDARVELLEKAKRKDVKVKEIYSFTQDISQYRFCPRAYYFFRKLKFAKSLNIGMTYGSIVHETLEFINKSIINGKKPNKDEISETARNIAIQKYRNGAVFIDKNMLDAAKKEIEEYVAFSDYYDKILDSELQISLAKSDYILTGNVDMIYRKDGKINLIDFKTGKNPLEAGNESLLEQYIGQLGLYSYLYKETKGESVDFLALYFTGLENEIRHLVFDASEYEPEQVIKNIESTIFQIENDFEFEKTEDISKCKNCDLRFYCDRV